MTKYHLTEIGPKPCKANIRSCPVGGTHFSDPSTAQKEFETGLKKEFGASKGITEAVVLEELDAKASIKFKLEED